MTLLDTLLRLHLAGRLASPLLPGMLLRQHGIRFARLAWKDDTHWHASYESDDVKGGWLRLLPGDLERRRNRTEIVLEDAATVGALLAQLREATELPGLAPTYHENSIGPWWSIDGDDIGVHGTEGEAIQAALVALAESQG